MNYNNAEIENYQRQPENYQRPAPDYKYFTYSSGENHYLHNVMHPYTKAVSIPDLDSKRHTVKQVLRTLNLTGFTELVMVYVPSSNMENNLLLGVPVTSPLDGSTVIGWTSSYPNDEKWSDDYEWTRLISAGLSIFCSTIPSGAFAINGRLTTAVFYQPPDFQSLDPNRITPYNSEDVKQNVSVQDGIMNIAIPQGPQSWIRGRPIYTDESIPLNRSVATESAVIFTQYPITGSSLGWNTSFTGASTESVYTSFPSTGNLMDGSLMGLITVDVSFEIFTLAATPTNAFYVNAFYINGLGGITEFVSAQILPTKGADTSTWLAQGSVTFDAEFPLSHILITSGAGTTWALVLSAASSSRTYVRVTASEASNQNTRSPIYMISLTGFSTDATLVINGVENREAIPNQALSKNVSISGRKVDHLWDYDFATTWLRTSPEAHCFFNRKIYMDLVMTEYFRKAAQRENLKGYALSFSDITDFFKSAGKTIVQAAPALLTAFGQPEAAKFATGFGRMLGLSASKDTVGYCMDGDVKNRIIGEGKDEKKDEEKKEEEFVRGYLVEDPKGVYVLGSRKYTLTETKPHANARMVRMSTKKPAKPLSGFCADVGSLKIMTEDIDVCILCTTKGCKGQCPNQNQSQNQNQNQIQNETVNEGKMNDDDKDEAKAALDPESWEFKQFGNSRHVKCYFNGELVRLRTDKILKERLKQHPDYQNTGVHQISKSDYRVHHFIAVACFLKVPFHDLINYVDPKRSRKAVDKFEVAFPVVTRRTLEEHRATMLFGRKFEAGPVVGYAASRDTLARMLKALRDANIDVSQFEKEISPEVAMPILMTKPTYRFLNIMKAMDMVRSNQARSTASWLATGVSSKPEFRSCRFPVLTMEGREGEKKIVPNMAHIAITYEAIENAFARDEPLSYSQVGNNRVHSIIKKKENLLLMDDLMRIAGLQNAYVSVLCTKELTELDGVSFFGAFYGALFHYPASLCISAGVKILGQSVIFTPIVESKVKAIGVNSLNGAVLLSCNEESEGIPVDVAFNLKRLEGHIRINTPGDVVQYLVLLNLKSQELTKGDLTKALKETERTTEELKKTISVTPGAEEVSVGEEKKYAPPEAKLEKVIKAKIPLTQGVAVLPKETLVEEAGMPLIDLVELLTKNPNVPQEFLAEYKRLQNIKERYENHDVIGANVKNLALQIYKRDVMKKEKKKNKKKKAAEKGGVVIQPMAGLDLGD